MAIHSSGLAWRIPGMGEPGGLPSMGSHRVRHNWSNLAAAAAGGRVGCLFVIFVVCWGMIVLLWTSLLELSLPCPIGFGLLFFHLHMSLRIFFLISSLISPVIHWLFSSIWFSLHVFVFFSLFSYSWFLILQHCGQRRCLILFKFSYSFPCGSVGKEYACNVGDQGSISGSERSPGERKWQSTPVFLPGEFHGQRSLVGYNPWGLKELDTTEQLNTFLNLPRLTSDPACDLPLRMFLITLE